MKIVPVFGIGGFHHYQVFGGIGMSRRIILSSEDEESDIPQAPALITEKSETADKNDGKRKGLVRIC